MPEPQVQTACNDFPAVEPVHTELPTAEPDQSQGTIPASPRASIDRSPNLAATRPTREHKKPTRLIESTD